jgi:DNA (cytosine-5)-methyltransferase 1
MDFESETFVATVAPDIAQALRARDGAKGVDSDCTDTLVPVCITGDITHALNTANNGNGCSEDGTGRGVPTIVYPIQEVGKRTGASTTDVRAGIGIGSDVDPMFILQAGAQHGVAYRTSGNCGASETGERVDALTTGTDQGSHLLAFSAKDHGADVGVISPTLRAMGHAGSHPNAGGQVAVAFAENQRNELRLMDIAGSQSAIRRGDAKNETLLAGTMSVRRLTPLECSRLQGFPDGYTLIPTVTRQGNAKWRRIDADEAAYLAAQGAEVMQGDDGRWLTNAMADGPRYKGFGNSWCVPVVEWIFKRIDKELSA